jgi:hypothetical protein
MRASLIFLTATAAGAVLLSQAAMADPYVYRQTDGSWTNSEYSDGGCRVYSSRNAYDGETHVTRYGNCSNVAIGPDGQAVRVAPAPTVVYTPY